MFETLKNIYLTTTIFSSEIFESLKLLILNNLDEPNFIVHLRKFLHTSLKFYKKTQNMVK